MLGVRGTVEAQTPIRSILVVDDDDRVLAGLARGFSAQRTVFTATSLETAAIVARRERLDLAVVDMRLGNDSGLDVVRLLKLETPHIILVLISGYLSIDTAVLATRAGADLIMSKPVSVRDVLRRIEHGINNEHPNIETPTLAQVESEHIARVMTDCNGNVSEAARRLGIYRSSLQRKLRKQSIG